MCSHVTHCHLTGFFQLLQDGKLGEPHCVSLIAFGDAIEPFTTNRNVIDVVDD